MTQQLMEVSIDQIQVQPGFNHRQYFDDDALASLTESIKRNGVLQPLVVRQEGESLSLVAGERRFRASRLAGLTSVPVMVRDFSEREALEASLDENAERDDISPAEEATVARRAVHLADGNEAEAAKRLGWNIKRLQARLMLLHACDAVLSKLASREIGVGHAELLSTLPAEAQPGLLAKIIEHGISVADFKAQLTRFAQELSAAPFDKGDCNLCPHNSSSQASLFEENIGEGRCSNKSCWDGKVQAFLAETRETTAQEFPLVALDQERDPATFGPVDLALVGESQYRSCQGCQSFGAVICSQPGREGRVAKSICFDLSCRKTKAAAHAPPPSAPAAKTSAPSASRPRPPAKDAAKANGNPKAVKSWVLSRLAQVATEEVLADRRVLEALMLVGLEKLAQARSFGSDCPSIDRVLALLDADADAYEAAIGAATAKFFEFQDGNACGKRARTVIARTRAALPGRVVVDEALLKAMTKSSIASLLDEVCFWTALDGDDETAQKAALAKLMKGKNDDIIKAVLAVSFDWAAHVPSLVQVELKGESA